MKYAIAVVLDQTCGYWTGDTWTTKHPEAALYDSLKEAEQALPEPDAWIEEVQDPVEFRFREDTW